MFQLCQVLPSKLQRLLSLLQELLASGPEDRRIAASRQREQGSQWVMARQERILVYTQWATHVACFLAPVAISSCGTNPSNIRYVGDSSDEALRIWDIQQKLREIGQTKCGLAKSTEGSSAAMSKSSVPDLNAVLVVSHVLDF